MFAVADEGVTCFLVDRDMGWKSEPIPTMGQWGPASLVFQDVRVPHSAILGEEGHGLQTALFFVHENRIRQAASSLGAGQFCINEAVAYAKHRTTWGKSLASNQASSRRSACCGACRKASTAR